MNKYLIIGVAVVVIAAGVWWGTQKQDVSNNTLAAITTNVTSGSAPLVVTFTPRFMGMGEIWIEFGDGQRVRPSCEAKPDTDGCKGEYMSPIVHTYTKAGIYTVTYSNTHPGGNKEIFGTVVVSAK